MWLKYQVKHKWNKMATFPEELVLTDGILSSGASRGFTGFAHSCHVHSTDSKFILCSLSEACNVQAPLCHQLPVQLGPVHLLRFFLFYDVTQDGGLSIICRLLPAHSHMVLCHVGNQWGLTWAGDSWKRYRHVDFS